MANAQGVGSQWQAAATSLPLSSPESTPPPCLALPFPEGWDQGTSLEAGKPGDQAGSNCSQLSDRRGFSSVWEEGLGRNLD